MWSFCSFMVSSMVFSVQSWMLYRDRSIASPIDDGWFSLFFVSAGGDKARAVLWFLVSEWCVLAAAVVRVCRSVRATPSCSYWSSYHQTGGGCGVVG